jgi:hypothetical protein
LFATSRQSSSTSVHDPTIPSADPSRRTTRHRRPSRRHADSGQLLCPGRRWVRRPWGSTTSDRRPFLGWPPSQSSMSRYPF